MIALVCRKTGYKVTGQNLIKTEDHYIMEIQGVTHMFKIDEWEEVRND